MFSVVKKKTAYVITPFSYFYTPLHFQIKIKFPSWRTGSKTRLISCYESPPKPIYFQHFTGLHFFNKVTYGVVVFPASSKNVYHGLTPIFFLVSPATLGNPPNTINTKHINLFVIMNELIKSVHVNVCQLDYVPPITNIKGEMLLVFDFFFAPLNY